MKNLLLFLIFVSSITLYSGEYIEVSKEFTLFTSKNLEGYSKPFFTSIHEAVNTNIFHTAQYPDAWSFGIELATMGMIIPSSDKTFDAELPEDFGNTSRTEVTEFRNGSAIRNVSGTSLQPTIYGGESYSVYSAPQNAAYSYNKSVAFAEGNDNSFMPGVPNFEFFIGFPTQTQLRFMVLPLNVQDEIMPLISLKLNQQINQWLGLFRADKSMALAMHYSLFTGSRTGLEITSHAFGFHFSKTWDGNISFYSGLQYEALSGLFKAERESNANGEFINSPYEEVRNNLPLEFDISSDNSFRLVAGASYRYGIVDLHIDAALAHQPVLSAGFSLYFYDGNKKFNKEYRYFISTINRIEPNLVLNENEIKTKNELNLKRKEFERYRIDLAKASESIKRVYANADAKSKGEIEDLKIQIEDMLSQIQEFQLKLTQIESNLGE